jgi:hypothetical protein
MFRSALIASAVATASAFAPGAILGATSTTRSTCENPAPQLTRDSPGIARWFGTMASFWEDPRRGLQALAGPVGQYSGGGTRAGAVATG